MVRYSSSRKTADALRKTIQQLESDPTVDITDAAFVSLKCALLSRILQFETRRAHVESHIHLVQATGSDEERAESCEEDSDSAIA